MSESRSSLAHQFTDLEQQSEAASLGMWVFLATEIMFFGGMFAGYFVYRSGYPEGFSEASHHLDVLLGGINTAVLIGSSLTMALAVHAAQTRRRRALAGFLLGTILLGSTFLGIKIVEYSHKFTEHLIPGQGFHLEGPDSSGAEIFFSFYFAMTGMHALHMVIGIAVLAVLLYQATLGRFSSGYYTPVELTGLYWHFVDIVWIFIFPLLYLLGRH